VKELETKLLEKPHVLVTSSLCEVCVSLKGKLLQEVAETRGCLLVFMS
jgi:hypothetical protein